MNFELLSPAEAKAYVKKPRMGRATFPFFNPDLMEEPAQRTLPSNNTGGVAAPEDLVDSISTGSAEGKLQSLLFYHSCDICKQLFDIHESLKIHV